MKKFDIEKVANAIKFFLNNNVQYLGKTKLMKLLFFADKLHLQKFGKPIFYDRYFKLPFGPVPTLTLNIIDSLNEIENQDLRVYTEKFKKHIEIEEQQIDNIKQNRFKILNEFDKDYFSKSEIEVLKQITKEYRDLNAKDISEISHKLPEYKYTEMLDMISYEDMALESREYITFIQETNRDFERIFK